jgi:hypothetical protein
VLRLRLDGERLTRSRYILVLLVSSATNQQGVFMNTQAFIAIVAAFAICGCARQPVAVQQRQTSASGPTSLAPVGRYQAVAVSRTPGSGLDSVLIVDTRDGDLWQWLGPAGPGPVMLRYMGHLTPGGHMGDVIEQKSD